MPLAERQLPDWLSAYLQYTEETEPPTSYHVWTGLSVLSGALQRRVWMRWGHEVIYPNLYIVLVGPSGRCRKGTALGIGKDLLREINNVTLASESITREALIKLMKDSVTNYNDHSTIKFQCAITCISPELSVFLGEKDVKFLSALTDWYDSHDEWEYSTMARGAEKVNGVCFNLLGATAPDWIASMIPQEAIGGGFTSRCIFVVEGDKRKSISHPIYTENMARLREALIHDLRIISNIVAEGKFDREANQAYEVWYEQEEVKIKRGELPVDDPRFSAYCERRATHIKKLSMVLSASRSNRGVITLKDFDRARQMLRAVELKMSRTFGGLGKSRYSEAVQLVLDHVARKGKTSRSEVLSLYYRDIDTPTLKVVEEVMEQMRVVRLYFDPTTRDMIYELNTKPTPQLRSHG